MSTSCLGLLGGLALGCSLAGSAAGSASAQNPAPAPETAATPLSDSTPPPPGASTPQAGRAAAAETTATSDSSVVVIRFSPLRDAAAQHAADSLELTPEQRTIFFRTFAEGVSTALRANPASPQPAIDSVRSLVVVETGRKMRFVRQARLIFADMFSRRARDKARAPGTEEELWRSPKNVETLIALYREKPNASDDELEHAMAPSFSR